MLALKQQLSLENMQNSNTWSLCIYKHKRNNIVEIKPIYANKICIKAVAFEYTRMNL